jgi:Fic-DOC domain mobile mystery protein B
MKITYPLGATPLDPNESAGLLHSIHTQSELNELEQENIIKGLKKIRRRSSFKKELMTPSGLLRLHYELFGEVWSWAGRCRTSIKNLGVDPYLIQVELLKLCEDVDYWVSNSTFAWVETAARFHHRLVEIHPFANGNGRHSRIAADLLLEYNKQSALTWGSESLIAVDVLRSDYIRTLKLADRGDYSELIRFAQS